MNTPLEMKPLPATARPRYVNMHGLEYQFAIPRSTAYKLFKAGKLRSVKKGGVRYIEVESILEYFNSPESN